MTNSVSHPDGTILGLRPGDIIDGRIEIANLIGYGGQGVVLLVNHLEWNRDLALKLPLPEVVSSPIKRERYLREAETWIKLGVHPHIVRCWFVKKISGLPGLFLDYIKGGSLDSWIKDGVVRPGEWVKIASIIIHAAEGLAHSHSMGVVHRDIKPENLLIRPDNRICVTDFGLVKSVKDSSVQEAVEPSSGGLAKEEDLSITGAGEFLGTPRYGAPEQWNRGEVTPATDAYALGTIFYEMLCGRRPFDENGVPIKLGELILGHLRTPAPDPREFNPNVPSDLAKICLSCLEKDPAKRPPSMGALIESLSEALQRIHGPAHNRPEPVPGGDRPDLLNNAAVSLYSLGKSVKARELLQQGLRIEAGHPQCLYNLVQLDRREGKIDPAESLRQLRRASLKYPLALLCMEEGLGKKAIELLDSITDREQNGLTFRTKGDALMYAKQYLLAQRAYDKAQEFMPNDQPTRLRKLLAAQGLRGMEGHVLFPSSVSCYNNRVANPELQLLISHQSEALVGVNAQEVVLLDIDSHSLISQCERPEGALPPLRVWLGQERLLIQDANGFELWRIPELRALQRSQGRILAATADLKRIVLLKREGVFLLDKIKQSQAQLQFPPGTQPSGSVGAVYAANGQALCVLTPDGRLAKVDEEHRVVPLPWPKQVDSYQDVCAMGLSETGVLYLAHQNGLFQALNLAFQRIEFSHRLPFQVARLFIDITGETVVASSPSRSGVFHRSGKILYRGEGPIGVESKRTRCIAYAKGRLTLYELNPFRRVRSWSEKIQPPRSIHIAEDGRRAASLSVNGDHHVWEVDEDNRVFERSLLLTPGQTYGDLIAAYQIFCGAYAQAKSYFEQRQYLNSYKELAKARRVQGFHQDEHALELEWKLLHKLRRGKMAAIWERLSMDAAYVSRMSDDSRYIAMFRHGEIVILRNDGSKTTPIRTLESQRLLIGFHFLGSGDKTQIVMLDQTGEGGLFKVEDGSLVHKIQLDSGPLRRVAFQKNSLFYVTIKNIVGHYDLESRAVTSKAGPMAGDVRRLFPYRKDKAVVVLEQGAMMLELKKKKPQGTLPIGNTKMPAPLTYLGVREDCRLIMMGFADGTVLACDAKSYKVLYAANHKGGAVTGFDLSVGLSLGVAVTENGKLTLWDLHNGDVFEQFTAHPTAVRHLRLSEDGRYLTTIARNGQFRLWETNWSLVDGSGPPPVDWLPTSSLLGKLFKLG